MTKLRYTAAVLVVALIVVACSSGPGTSPEMTLSPPDWLHGTWTSPVLPEDTITVTADNWIDTVTPLDVKMSGYDRVSLETTTSDAYGFSYRLEGPPYEPAYKGVISFRVARTETGIAVQTAFDPPHPDPMIGAESPLIPFVKASM